jgi:Family of unknown function (DUF5681)
MLDPSSSVDISSQQHPARWKPGQSGNPKGRPKGARHAAIEAFDQLGRDAAVRIIQATIQAAEQGDTRAAELVLRRVWPMPSSRPVVVTLPMIKTAADALEATTTVLAAVAEGRLDPHEGRSLLDLIEGTRRVIETADL